MSARALRFDEISPVHDEVRSRTRWTMTVSFLVHTVLMLLLILAKPSARAAEAITEIALVSPGDLEPAPAVGAPAVARAEQPLPGARVADRVDEHFTRVAPLAELAPDPQTLTAADRMSARLASLREAPATPIASGSTVGAPSALWSAPSGVPGSVGTAGQSLTLSRGAGTGSGPPLALGRGGTGTSLSPALAGAGAPSVAVDRPAGATEGEAVARRTIAGASLAGPIADRPVLHMETPVYPEWAKRDGVEGAVTLYFIVRADGTVKENVLIQKTAGFADLDENARIAISAWRFEPLRGGRTGEQWGTITFHYRLRGA